MADAFDRAVETAYKAVMKPKEGTILTVAKGAAEKSRELADAGVEDFDEFIPAVIEHAEIVLAGTPDLLPVLKQAGVVDSGGQGLVQVLKGTYEAYSGQEIDYAAIAKEASSGAETKRSGSGPLVNQEVREQADIKFGYCTEFIVMLEKNYTPNEEKDFKNYLESIGDSIVCVYDDDSEIVKVHVHTNNPGLAIQRGLLYGQLNKLKIDNMRYEHKEKLLTYAEKERIGTADVPSEPDPEILADKRAAEPEQPRKEVGFIAVSVGSGIEEIFRGLGVDYVLSGGQTMNPSTEDILNAIDKVNASTIFVLPNNKNIIMAANQAAELMTTKKVIVIPTKTIPQGITAVINYMPDVSAEVSRDNMLAEIAKVRTVEITYAVRDTTIDDKEIKEGNMMAIGDGGILSVGEDIEHTALEAMEQVVDDSTEILSVYYGEDVTEEQAESFRKDLAKRFPDLDIELQSGGQPIYYYILSAE